MLRSWKHMSTFEERSSLRSWLYRIATNTCLDTIEKRPKRVLPIDYGPPADPHGGPGEPVVESVWIEPYPDEDLGSRTDSPRPARDYERRESVELAFVAALQHLPAEPARGPDPARGARLLGEGGRGDARHLGRLRQQRDAARPRGGRRAHPRAAPSRRRSARSATRRSASWSRSTSTPGSAPTSTRSSRCSPRTPASRCRRSPAGSAGRRAAATRSASSSPALPALGATGSGGRDRDHANGAAARSASTSGTAEAKTPSCPSRSTSSPCDGERISDVTAFVTRSIQNSDSRLGALARPARRPRHALRHLRALRATRPARAVRFVRRR